MKIPPTIGLIAGGGELPLWFARQARAKGFSLKTAAIRGVASRKLDRLSDDLVWISIGQLGALIQFFKKHKVRQAVMQGKVEHSQLFKNFRLDWKAVSIWAKLKDRSGEALLKAVAGELSHEGIKLKDGRFLMEKVLTPSGLLTGNIDRESEKTVQYGLKRARALARLGVGQMIVVKNKAVVAVEAMEGTDAVIRRAGKWAGPGTIVIKVSSPRQDWRFDVPTMGPRTIQRLIEAKAAGIVLEAGRSFFLDRDRSLEKARKSGLFIRSISR
jgi:DUF1009 family protein